MSETLAISGASLRADAEALRAISQNVANVNTPGYRRVVTHATAFEAVAALADPSAVDTLQKLSTPVLGSAIDVRGGTLQASSAPWHLAIEGDGYFVLSTPQGERLTRRGDFHLDADGRVVSHNGFPVLGTAGELRVTDTNARVAADGSVMSGSEARGQLRIVSGIVASDLIDAGDGTWTLAANANPPNDSRAIVRAGFLEASNVAPVEEMLRLMETMRHFETTQKFVRGADDLLSAAISTLGKV
jgi:flagellar basal-body rod protein FlgF